MRAFFPFRDRGVSWEVIVIPAFFMFLIFYFMALQGYSSVYNLVLNNIILTLICGAFLFGFPFAYMRWKNIPLSEAGLRMPERKHAGHIFVAVAIVFIFIIFVYQLLGLFPVQSKLVTKNAFLLGLSLFSSGDPRFWLVFFIVVFAVPFIEEFYFRGVVYSFLRRRKGLLASIAINTAFFSLFHALFHTYIIYLLVVLLSIIACLLMEKTKSIAGPLISHSFLNGFAFFYVLYLRFLPIEILFTLTTGLIIAVLFPLYFLYIGRQIKKHGWD